MPITVRMATEADLAAIADIGRRTWHATYEPFAGPEYVARGLAHWWSDEALRRGLPRALIAEDASATAVGMASCAPDGDVLIVWKLYVLPESQGTGAGTALLRRVIADAGGHYAAVRLEYLDGNDTAARFYERNGFTFLRRESSPDRDPDSVWLERPLPTKENT
ncbi:MAG TPA: GNAT family N-acetyltransferase [Pseudonocardiaceae bacterium]|nr:GNAT family N-acetyltransferase [Pseudonocardiaceae bacterium]